MPSAAPGRLRDFFSSRTGIVLVVIGALGLAGAIALALRGEEESDLGIILEPTTTTTVTTAPPPSADGVLLGASISSEIRNAAAEVAAVEELERALGRSLDIHHNFYTFDAAFPTAVERSDLQSGRIPMISWNGRGVTTRAIAAGRHDDLIRQRARDTKALDRPVLVRWFWEMDGKKKAEWAGTPDEYVAAWRHIVGIFRAEGADNVRWVWCPNASAFNDGEAQAFYPGPDFVDWICGDGYNWAPGRPGDDYRSFTEIFSGFYLWAAQQNKPIMVGEFGVQERKPGEKADWINATRQAIKTDFPRMKAIVYFSANKDYDWRLTTSESALAAFRQMAHDPWFNLGVDRRLPE